MNDDRNEAYESMLDAMIDVHPDWVRNALGNWEGTVFLAYDSYVRHGRVALVIEEDANDPHGARYSALPNVSAVREYDPAIADVLDRYDPDREFVIQFDDRSGTLRTQRLGTPPGMRNPRRVWLFETARRLEEEPDRVDPGMPRTFVGLLDLLDALKRRIDAGDGTGRRAGDSQRGR